jgi:riboflavin kinase/FMN adenylyltransferase
LRVSRNRPVIDQDGADVSPVSAGRSVVTVGNFDGVHRGHQALLDHCKTICGDDESVTVVTFEPLPITVLHPEFAPARLSNVYDKLTCLKNAGVDHVWLMRFDESLARLSPEEFVQRVLVGGLNISRLVVGEDFRFGKGRQGDIAQARALGETLGFEVHTVPDVLHNEQRISSSAVREGLAKGAFDSVAEMLNRRFTISGHVVPGKRLGRKLGYPTANLLIRAIPSPVEGIFAAWTRVIGEEWKPAVVSLGRRPTFGGEEPLLEVHFFDFNGDLYGKRLEVDFVEKLRSEALFDHIDDLVIQMVRDEGRARTVLAERSIPDS